MSGVTVLPHADRRLEKQNYPVIHKAQGIIPPSGMNSSIAITQDEKVFLFGGFDKYSGDVDNVVHILDLKTNIWTKHPTRNHFRDKPCLALVGHTAVVKDGTIVIFGGESEDQPYTSDLYYYSPNTNEWNTPTTKGQIPSPRSRHASCLSLDGKRMYVTGGLINSKDVANDLYWYEFDTQRWNGPLEFVPRFGHTITMYNNKIWAFGGLTPDMDRVSELAWYDLETNAIGKVRIISMEDPFKSSLNSPGLHFYESGITGTMLHVVTAGSAIRNVETSISALDLDTLKTRSIISDCSKYFDGYSWHHMITLGSKLILLGQSGTTSDDERLSDIFSLDLTEFGYLESSKGTRGDKSPTGTIANDMFEFFNRSELVDFEITAVEGDRRPPLFHAMPTSGYMNDEDSQDTVDEYLGHHGGLISRNSPSLLMSESEPNLLDRSSLKSLNHKSSAVSLDRSKTGSTVGATKTSSLGIASPYNETHSIDRSDLPLFTVSEPIKVHMMVLFARWPHFSRIMSSQMNEYHSRKLYIPEPITWVRKLIEFMYRDSIDGCTIEESAGLLILANLYELPRLRTLCIESISKLGITDSTAVIIWQRAVEADEEVIRRNAALYCFRHWGQIVRSSAFHELEKESMIALCEEADSNSFISSYTPAPTADNAGEEDEEPKDEVLPSSTTGFESDDPYEAYEDDMDLWN